MLAGGVKVKDADYYTDDNGNVYTKNGSTLTINGTLTIDNYSNGNVGISLCDEPPTPPDLGQGDYSQNRQFDPLVLDMDGDGVELVSLNKSTTYFDLSGDGIKEKTGWVNPDDALLVLDKNNNGKIDDISELFGSPTQIGFEVLKGQDTDLNGVIDKNDLQFSKLKVWNDLNGNGFADAGELRTLDEAGVKSINLNYSKTNQNINGNTISEVSTYNSSVVLNNGTTRTIADANFLVDQFNSKSNSQTPIDPEIALLPTLKGYGIVEYLQKCA